MDCPRCGKDCFKPAEEIISKLDSYYIACAQCAPEPNLEKDKPLRDLPREIDRCEYCGKAPLDAVMLDALRVLAEHGLRDNKNSLRSVGSPLINVGYPLAYSPRLGPKNLIIIAEDLTKDAAEDILRTVPEVKGVILNRGIPGVVGFRREVRENILLAGCDLRCDVAQSLFGELVIYKNQSEIHIEFPRQSAPKMKILENLYLQGKIRDVVDGLCGPGTLGLMCVLAGAERVILNDIWLPAIENVMLNLEANRNLLQIDKIEHNERPLTRLAKEPRLISQASGACEIEVYHGELTLLFSRARPGKLCLIDHFPGARTSEIEKACNCCREIIII